MIRSSEEEFVVKGDIDGWFQRCKSALLELTDNVSENKILNELEGTWSSWLPPHKETVTVTLLAEDSNQVKLKLRGSVNISLDWVVMSIGFGLSLHHKVLKKFKAKLD